MSWKSWFGMPEWLKNQVKKGVEGENFPPRSRNNLKTWVLNCVVSTHSKEVCYSSAFRDQFCQDEIMAFAILRTEKLKSFGEIGGSLAHNYRTRLTPNADPSRTKYNEHQIKRSDLVMDAIKARLPEKVRSNAVLCIEYMITASPEWENWGTEKEQDFFNQSIDWLKKRHGAENVISTSIHRDETTPHLVAYVVPIDAKGKLNCRNFLGGKAILSKMQTEFHNKVSYLGLERGLEGSKAEHKTIREFYAELQALLPPTKEIKNIEIQKLGYDQQPHSPFLDSKQLHGERVMDAVYHDVNQQIAEIKKQYAAEFFNMQQSYERLLATERQKAESERKAHKQAVTDLSKSLTQIKDLKAEFEQFIEYKRMFPQHFHDLKSDLEHKITQHKYKERALHEYKIQEQQQLQQQKQKNAEQKRLESIQKASKMRSLALRDTFQQKLEGATSEAEKAATVQIYNEILKNRKTSAIELMQTTQDPDGSSTWTWASMLFRKEFRFDDALDQNLKYFKSMLTKNKNEDLEQAQNKMKICAAIEQLLEQKTRQNQTDKKLQDKIDEFRRYVNDYEIKMSEYALPILTNQQRSRIQFEKQESLEKQKVNQYGNKIEQKQTQQKKSDYDSPFFDD
ncbi:MobV family relaxase [Acinetobacter brisouii]|uniref:MobV family relaxase n=1 Tax=Acinetobacter brisouii TaxID=396323 RepID=UPI00124F5A3C|nr:MobV family relaxase [Acinetobacter brisouii]